MPYRILVVDDEESIREFLEIMLKRDGYQVTTANNGAQALEHYKKTNFDLIITDIQMPQVSGMELLEQVKDRDPDVVVVMITAFGSTESAVEAMKKGAYDYITKPFKIDEIKLTLQKALEKRSLVTENVQLKRELGKEYSFSNIIGSSAAMLRIFEMVKRLSTANSNVIISGESGSGKELVAKALHYNSNLKDKPFVTVNCGAIPENLMESELFGHKKGSFTGAVADKRGLFEVANGGTIFLDEIGELPSHMQVKLLRVLQEGTFRRVGGTEDVHVNVRVIAATNRHLEQMISKGQFREDLYYRLNVIHIQTPPLRDRRTDVPILAQHFLNKYTKEFNKPIKGISTEALDLIKRYEYPGNVRELENIMERAVALESSSVIMPESLPASLRMPQEGLMKELAHVEISPEGVDLEKMVGEFEKTVLIKALRQTGGIKKHAAKLLNITFRSMRYRVEKYHLDEFISDQDMDE